MRNTVLRVAAGFCLAFLSGSALAQSYSENFDDVATLAGSGWVIQNNSSPLGPNSWYQGIPTNAAPDPGPFNAFNGAVNAYVAANFASTTGGTGTISNWLMTPNRTYRNGDVFTFYTRKPTIGAGQTDFPDRLEVRLSTNGASTNVGGSAATLGDFTTLLLSINPTLVTNVYPQVWTQYTITISGLPAPTSGRIAFRYFVTNGGPSGSNSDYIGIDAVVYTPYVCPAFTISPSTLPGGSFGVAYSQSLSQTGALGAPNYAITAGALPPGMTISAAGVVSGSPTATGTFNFTVTANDASGCSGSRPYSITVVAGPQSITFGAQTAQVYSENGTFEIDPLASASSGLDVTYGSSTPLVCTVSGTTVTIVAAGTCTITADQAGDGNYNPAPQATQDVVIAQAAQVLTFPAQTIDTRFVDAGQTFQIDPLATSATPNSGEPIVYSSLDIVVCTVVDTTVTMVGEGTCQIAADQAGNANYSAAAQVTVDVELVQPTEADLSVVKSVEKPTAILGETVSYTLVFANAGPADAPNVNVLDLAPNRLDPSSVVWSCVGSTGGAVCPTPSSDTGDLDANVSLPDGGTVTFELMGEVIPAANAADDFTTFTNSATISLLPGSGLTDPVPANNTDSADVQVQADSIFKDGFEG